MCLGCMYATVYKDTRKGNYDEKMKVSLNYECMTYSY